MSFIHTHPGIVNTPLLHNVHWVFTPVAFLAKFAATSIEDAGEYMASALFSPAYRQGAFIVDGKGDPISATKLHVTDDARAKLVEHYKKEVALQ